MAELFLTDAERSAASYLNWSDEALGKMVKLTAALLDDEYGAESAKLRGSLLMAVSVLSRSG